MHSRWRLYPFVHDDPSQAQLWRAVAANAGASLVQMPEFVFSCAASLHRRPLKLAVFEDGGQPMAVALVDTSRALRPAVFIEDQMPLGAWVQHPSLDFAALAAQLTAELGVSMQLGVSQLDARFVSRPADGDRLSTLDYMTTPWLQVEGSFDDYWQARGKNLRANLRKQRDRLVAQGVSARLEVLTAHHDMVRAVADYAALESAGWKSQGGTALSDTHPQTAFYALMLQAFAGRQESRVYRYFFDDRLVATELCLCDDRELVILKTTYDETVTPYSPAALLRQEMLAALFGEGKGHRVEFYGPLKEWHTRWTPLSRQVYHANVFRNLVCRMALGQLRRWSQPTGEGAPSA